MEDCPTKGITTDLIRFEEPALKDIILLPSRTGDWKLATITSQGYQFERLVEDKSYKTISFKEWFEFQLLQFYGIGVVWALSSLTGATGGKWNLNIAKPSGRAYKINLANQLRNSLDETIMGKAPTNFWNVISGVLQDIITLAGRAASAATPADLCTVGDTVDLQKVQLKGDIERYCQIWQRSLLDTSKPEDIEVVFGKYVYKGAIFFTGAKGVITVSTHYRIGSLDTDSKLMYSGSGSLVTGSDISLLGRTGLISVVPLLPSHVGVDIPKAMPALIWLIPKYPEFVGTLQKKYHLLRKSEDSLTSMLAEKVHQTLIDLKNYAVSTIEPKAGISYVSERDSHTAAKINKEVFALLRNEKLPNTFQVLTNHMVAGADTLWALLYSSLLPTTLPRKTLLYFAGSGGSFKTHLIHRVYKTMLESTIFMEDGILKIKREVTQGNPVFLSASANDIRHIAAFGNPAEQYYVCKAYSEVPGFNIESKEFIGLKSELGDASLTFGLKFVTGKVTIPSSKLHVVDSNYTPVDWRYEKATSDRVGECIIFSQSALIQDTRTGATSNNERLYFAKLVLPKEKEYLSAALGKDFSELAPDEEELALALLLFKAIMGHGRKCYEKLTGSNGETYLPIDPVCYDRRAIARGYVKLAQLSNISARKDPVLTFRTVADYWLRACVDNTQDGELTFEELNEFNAALVDNLWNTYETKDGTTSVAKKRMAVRLTDTVIKEYFKAENLDFWMGCREFPVEVDYRNRKVKGICLPEWVKTIQKKSSKRGKEGTFAYDIQEEIARQLAEEYTTKMFDSWHEDLILKPDGKGW